MKIERIDLELRYKELALHYTSLTESLTFKLNELRQKDNPTVEEIEKMTTEIEFYKREIDEIGTAALNLNRKIAKLNRRRGVNLNGR